MTVSGAVIPNAWFEDGELEGVLIETERGEGLIVDPEGKLTELFGHVGGWVEAFGEVYVTEDVPFIRIERFRDVERPRLHDHEDRGDPEWEEEL